ncbi:MAG TPA: four-carbon acid sugar kinase family protein [Tepidisphaeraceae bacterium]
MNDDRTTATSSAAPPPVLGFYGDDFAGSTAVLEVLTLAGVPAVLFVRPPSAADLAKFPGVRAFGIAGRTRSMAPAEAEGTLRLAFESFREAGAALVHYNVCSAFNSSPTVGSAGRVMEVGLDVFGESIVPIVGGAALREHLAAQTSLPVGLLEAARVAQSPDDAMVAYEQCCRDVGRGGVLIEPPESRPATVGRLLLAGGRRFVIGSSAVEAALCAAWAEQDCFRPAVPLPSPGPAMPTLAVCGGTSPETAEQIRCAIRDGFVEVLLSPNALGPGEINNAMMNAVVTVTHALGLGRDVVLHTQTDHRIAHTPADDARLGTTLGHVLRLSLQRRRAGRVVVTGSGTAGRVAMAIGLTSLRMIAPLTPGVPLCVATAASPAINGLHMAFKSAKAGTPDFFTRFRDGRFD